MSQYYLPDINGDVTRLLNSIESLKKDGFNITVVTAFPHYPYGKIPEKYFGKLLAFENNEGSFIIRVPIIPVPHKGLNHILSYSSYAFFSLLAVPFIDKPDVVWAFSQKLFSYFAGILFRLFKKSILVVDMTDVWPEAIVNTGHMKKDSLIFKIAVFLTRFTLSVADYVITLSEEMKAMICRKGVRPEKVLILPNSVEINLPIYLEASGRSPFMNGKFAVIYSGNIGSNYDFETLLEAALQLKDHEDILFIIRGKGELLDTVRKTVSEKDLKNVFLDDRWLSKDDLIIYLNRADAFILPMKKPIFQNASFPIKALEYMAHGKPIIYLGHDSLGLLLSSTNSGLVVDYEDVRGICQAVLSLKNNKEKAELMGRNARELAINMFSSEIFSEKITGMFKKMIRQKENPFITRQMTVK
ncbi:MAG: glycosyltransferase family 4 protein [Thermoproteota archaeon]